MDQKISILLNTMKQSILCTAIVVKGHKMAANPFSSSMSYPHLDRDTIPNFYLSSRSCKVIKLSTCMINGTAIKTPLWISQRTGMRQSSAVPTLTGLTTGLCTMPDAWTAEWMRNIREMLGMSALTHFGVDNRLNRPQKLHHFTLPHLSMVILARVQVISWIIPIADTAPTVQNLLSPCPNFGNQILRQIPFTLTR